MIITSAVDMSSQAVSPVFIHPSRQHPDTRLRTGVEETLRGVVAEVGPAAGPTTSRFGNDDARSGP